MEYYLAPMEGVTGPIYRRTVSEFFTPYDRAYTPFLSPTSDRKLTARMLSEVAPAGGIRLIPQLLTNNAENFLWAAQALQDLGYDEVNLNLGCPSGTVVKKKKGSGLLGQPDWLEAMLDEIFAKCPIRVSVKSRLGLQDAAEFERILEIYNRYPICELILHPRVQKQFYRGDVDMEAFRFACQNSRAPLCYNGNVFTPEDAQDITEEFPDITGIMLGRGAVANPGLISRLKSGQWAEKAVLREFHDTLYARYREAMPGLRPTIFKMRELWSYWACLFEGSEKALKHIRKAETFADYEAAVEALFRDDPFVPDGAYFA